MSTTDHNIMATIFKLCGLLLSMATETLPYKISTLDAMEACNQTIRLGDGPKSAAILTLTSKSYYDYTPMRCYIRFIPSMHRWSGLTGVLEEIDMRRFEDPSRRRHAENQCVDYILVSQVEAHADIPQTRQCGTWSVGGQDELSYLGYRRALIGYCPSLPSTSGSSLKRCGVSEIHVEVSVGERNTYYLWRNETWRPHRGFTLVVTAYMYSDRESECAAGLKSCGPAGYQQQKCVHQSLWCDHHINCGLPRNQDEMSCINSSVTMEGLVPVMVGPWVSVALLLLLLLAGLIFWRRSKPPPPPRDPRPPQEPNSYAESYEVSSTLSSAHHMAIQVRVVCNSGHGMTGSNNTHHHTSTTHLPPPPPHTLHRWHGTSTSTMDFPPSYDSLFPHGPPSPRGLMSPPPPSASAASLDITTTSMVSLASSTGPQSPGNLPPPTATATSSIVIPLSTIHTAPTFTHTTTESTQSTVSTTPPPSASTSQRHQDLAPQQCSSPVVQQDEDSAAISTSSVCEED